MSKYISNAINKMNRKASRAQVPRTTSKIMAADDVHRVAKRQPQLYKINSVPRAPRIQFGQHLGSGGMA